MLGHKLFQILRERFPDTVATMVEDVKDSPFDQVDLLKGDDAICNVDATDFSALGRLLNELRPMFVINCVGIVKQRPAAKDSLLSITLNSMLPHKLAEMARDWGGRVIHFSTDCVFDGARGGYTEDDDSTAHDLYGMSKFLGEVTCDNAITLRTSIIGRELVEHKSLLDWFLMQNHKTVRGFKRVIYSGVTTNQIAEVVTMVIRKYPTLSGLYQVVSEPIAKYDLLVMLRDAYKLDIEILPEKETICDRSMKGNKFMQATGYVSPSWQELLDSLASDMTPYEKWGIVL